VVLHLLTNEKITKEIKSLLIAKPYDKERLKIYKIVRHLLKD